MHGNSRRDRIYTFPNWNSHEHVQQDPVLLTACVDFSFWRDTNHTAEINDTMITQKTIDNGKINDADASSTCGACSPEINDTMMEHI